MHWIIWLPIKSSDRDNLLKLIWFFLIVLAFPATAVEAIPLILGPQINKIDLGAHLTFLRDSSGTLTLDDVVAAPLRDTFTNNGGNFNFAVTTDAIWLRLEVRRSPQAAQEWWLELAPSYIGEATLYHIKGDDDWAGTRPSRAGILLPLSSREFKARHSTFKIMFINDEPQTIYLRLRSNAQLNVRGYLWDPAFYAEQSASENLLLGAYYGAFCVIIGMCALRLWINRNPLDFWWLLYLLAESFVVLRMNGLASRYFFPESSWLNATAGTISLSIMVWAAARFGIHAFALNRNQYKNSYYAAIWIGNISLLIGLARLLDLEPASTICIFIISFLLCMLNCACSWRFMKSGEPSAKFYFSGIAFMTGCVMLVLARNFGIIPAYQFIDYIWQSNLITHAGLVSCGMILAQRERGQERLQATNYKNSTEKNLKSSALQKQMVALVSHEFRNSLSMLNVSMHAIKKRNDLPAEVVERHKNIVLVHRQMHKVIDNFLLEERIQNANINISYRRTDINSLIGEVIGLSELLGKNHDISSDLDKLPDFLWLDDGILRLILTNLLDNAVKYSAPASEVRIHGRFEDGLLYMSVTDNGIGMTTESLSHLFEPYFKADLTSDGIGIGLYMVRIMLHAHDGDLRVTSEIGIGSVFEFWLRAKPDDRLSLGDLNSEQSDFQHGNWTVAHMPRHTQK